MIKNEISQINISQRRSHYSLPSAPFVLPPAAEAVEGLVLRDLLV